MNRFIRIILKLFYFLFFKIEILFGLSHVQFKVCRKVSISATRFLRVAFVILYPFSCLRIIKFEKFNDSSVTLYVRATTYVVNWFLLIFIFLHETLNADALCQVKAQQKFFFGRLVALQSFSENFFYLSRCTLKFSIVLIGLIYCSNRKYSYNGNKNSSIWEDGFKFFLMLPFIIMAIASSRIYVANMTVCQFLTRNATELSEPTTLRIEKKIKSHSMTFKQLHDFFEEFNSQNALNLLTVISFCIFNITFHVNFLRHQFYRSNWHLLPIRLISSTFSSQLSTRRTGLRL